MLICFDDHVYQQISSKFVALKSCNCQNNHLELPKEVKSSDNRNYILIRILGEAFRESQVRYLTFQEGSCVEEICDLAFDKSLIIDVILPKCCRIIHHDSFFQESGQINIQIPKNSRFLVATDDGSIYLKYPFTLVNASNKQKRIFIRESAKIIKGSSFVGNSTFSKVFIPSSLTNLDSYTYYHHKSLIKLFFAKNSMLPKISIASFGFSSISKIIFPESIEVIEDFAFANCYQLIKVKFQKNSKLMNIHSCAFQYTRIKKVKFPISLSIIGWGAFTQCGDLNSLEFPTGSLLSKIEMQVFSGCNIADIKFDQNIKSILMNEETINNYFINIIM